MMRRTIILMITAVVALGAWAQGHRGYPPRTRVVVMRDSRPPRDIGWYNPWEWHRTSYGLRLGLNASQVRSEAPALNGTGVKAGLNVGFVIGTQLSHRTPLFVETGLYYTQKGGKSDNVSTTSGRSKFTYDLNYLELPVLLKYRHFTSHGVSIEPYAGGYLACGIAGDIKDYGDRKAFGSYSDGYFKRFDGGLKLGIGVGYGIGYADVSYDIGLANIGQDTFDDTHTGTFTFNIGVNF